MNQGHKEVLENAIASYRTHDASAAVANAFPEQSDLSVTFMGPMTGEQFVMFSDRVIDNFEEVIDNGLWSAFPSRMQLPTLNIPDIPQFTTQFVTLIGQNDCINAHISLNKLIKIQLDLGIWTLSEKSESPTRADVKAMAGRLNVQAKQMEAAQKALQELLDSAEIERKGLNAFTAEKKNEFDEVRKILAEAKENLNKITALLESSQKSEGEIKKVDESSKKVLQELEVQLGIMTKGYDTLKGDSDKLKTDLTEALSIAKEQQGKSDEQYNTILGYRETIEKYLGYSVDGYLGNKFDDRANKLRKGLKFWQWAVPISVVLSIAWVAIVFTCLRTDLGHEWVNLGINLLKTTPAFILMGFTFGQYGKERNLQEEYAFKSAVAMTINAYANLLAEKDSEPNKSRQQLILRALEEVHKQPKLYSDKGGTLISLKAREMRETMQTLNDTLQNLRS
jgi:hypothetical protein